MINIQMDDDLHGALDRLRHFRERIAAHRFDGSRERYPEIGEAEIKPLSDIDLIRVAITRELVHQRGVAQQLGMAEL